MDNGATWNPVPKITCGDHPPVSREIFWQSRADPNPLGPLPCGERRLRDNPNYCFVESTGYASGRQLHRDISSVISLTLRSVNHDQKTRMVSGLFSEIISKRYRITSIFRSQNAL